MTYLEVVYRYSGTLTPAQMRRLGELTGVYGLQRLRVEESKQEIRIEFDASRLKETEVVHLVRLAGIPVQEKLSAPQSA